MPDRWSLCYLPLPRDQLLEPIPVPAVDHEGEILAALSELSPHLFEGRCHRPFRHPRAPDLVVVAVPRKPLLGEGLRPEELLSDLFHGTAIAAVGHPLDVRRDLDEVDVLRAPEANADHIDLTLNARQKVLNNTNSHPWT